MIGNSICIKNAKSAHKTFLFSIPCSDTSQRTLTPFVFESLVVKQPMTYILLRIITYLHFTDHFLIHASIFNQVVLIHFCARHTIIPW